MARIRTIKPEFPQSESMGRVSRDARLLFVMLWTICDDHGRTRAHSRMLASLLFPYDEDAGVGIKSWLSELANEGCIELYEVDGSQYLQVSGWTKHQKIDKPSKPQFPGASDVTREGSRDNRERSSEEGIKDQGREGRGEEGKKAPAPPAAPTPPIELIPEEPSVIGFLLNDGSEYGISRRQVDEFQRLFPAIDAMQELRNLTAWCLGNKPQRKTRSGAMRFVTNWLSRAQNRGGSSGNVRQLQAVGGGGGRDL